MGLTLLILAGAALFVAYANGANDNFKGVATLYGSGALSYRSAIAWATAATVLGAGATLFLAPALARTFSGRGIVPAELVGDPGFAISVLAAAGVTVWIATVVGFPISTTHALLGGLVGAGMVASEGHLQWGLLAAVLVVPLLATPLASAGVSLVANGVACRLALARTPCICVDASPVPVTAEGTTSQPSGLKVTVATEASCARHGSGSIVRVGGSSFLRGIHILSGGGVCFARALNDTPKIVGLLLVVPALSGGTGLAMVAFVMGGAALLQGRRVADRMAKGITPMTEAQGTVTNLATSLIVIAASLFGLPASTTHVTCGSLFGLGVMRGDFAHRTVGRIIGSWVLTLPVAGFIAAGIMGMFAS